MKYLQSIQKYIPVTESNRCNINNKCCFCSGFMQTEAVGWWEWLQRGGGGEDFRGTVQSAASSPPQLPHPLGAGKQSQPSFTIIWWILMSSLIPHSETHDRGVSVYFTSSCFAELYLTPTKSGECFNFCYITTKRQSMNLCRQQSISKSNLCTQGVLKWLVVDKRLVLLPGSRARRKPWTPQDLIKEKSAVNQSISSCSIYILLSRR